MSAVVLSIFTSLINSTLSPLGEKVKIHSQLTELVSDVVKYALPGDTILVMSNGGFGGVHQLLLDALATKSKSAKAAL